MAKDIFLVVADGSTKEESVGNLKKKAQKISEENISMKLCSLLNEEVSGGKFRSCIVFSDAENLRVQLADENSISTCEHKKSGKRVFLFPGNGIYQKDMLGILKNSHPYLKHIIEECENGNKTHVLENDDYLSRQLQICISEIAVMKFWVYCGVVPDFIIGHSLGEYAVATATGVMSIENCIRMLNARGKILNEKMNDFIMLAVYASYEKVSEVLGGNVDVSAYNCPELITITIESSALERIGSIFKECGIKYNRLQLSGGGHSRKLKSAEKEFKEAVSDIQLNTAEIEIIPTAVDGADKTVLYDIDYWTGHLVNPVCFMQSFERLRKEDIRSMIDVGVSPVLLNMAMMNFRDLSVRWIPSIKSGRNYRTQLIKSASQLYLSGENIIWKNLFER